ncbi:MAG: phage holin family protein [Ruminococcus sp.]|nr:phage holin family protein [Ruminococcus sp.]
MEFSNLATVLPIVAICYLAGMGIKAFKIKKRFIPFIVGSLGGALGIVGYFIMSSFPANDLVTAVAIGIISGLASTGVNETVKTITKKDATQSDDEQQE